MDRVMNLAEVKKWYAPKYKLTYFNIEGSVEKVRLAFVLNGVDFEDVRLNWEEWLKIKSTAKFG